MGQLQDKCSCLSNDNNCFKSNVNFEFEKEDVSSMENGETNQFKFKSTNTFNQGESDINKIQKDPSKSERFSLKSFPQQRLSRTNQINIVQKTFRGFKFRKEFIKELKPKLIQHNLEILRMLEKNFKNVIKLHVENSNKSYQKDGWKKFYSDGERIFEYNYGLLFENRLRIYDNTSYYYGQINLKGEMHGYGIYVEKSGIKKQGHWRNNYFTGWGRIINSKGTIYEGHFIDGTLNGKGERISSNSHYEGDFKDGLRHGYGTDKTKEYIYSGYYKSDKKHGKGQIKFLNTKESYEGDFLENCLTGTGNYIWANRDCYQGTFLNGKMHGKGLYKWLDGGEYYGDYLNGVKEGKGRFKWADGKIFEGPFMRGKPHGIGKLYENNKTVSEVEFESGKIINTLSKLGKEIKNSPLRIRKTFTSTTGNINDEENN